MKLTRTIAAATAAATVALAGCSASEGDATSSDEESVTLVYAYDGLFSEPFNQIAEQLEEGNGLKLDLQLAGNSYDDSLARLQNDILGGDPPDIAMIGLSHVRQVVEAGAAVPLESFIDEDEDFDLSQYGDGMLDLTTFDGQLYGMPNAVSTAIMYYNPDIFEASGLDPDTPPQTWGDVEQAAQTIVESGAAEYGHWTDFESVWTYEAFLRSNGGDMMDAEENGITFNDEPGVEVLRFWRRMVDGGLMPAFGTDDGRETFFRGDVAMAIDSSSQVGNYERTTGFDLRTAKLPIPADGDRKTPGGGNALIITATDPERQQRAWEALKSFVSPEGSTTITTSTGYLPSNAYAAESDEYLGEFFASTPTRQAPLEQGETLVRWFSWPGEHGPEIGKILQGAIYRAVTGEQQPEAALDQAASEAEELLP